MNLNTFEKSVITKPLVLHINCYWGGCFSYENKVIDDKDYLESWIKLKTEKETEMMLRQKHEKRKEKSELYKIKYYLTEAKYLMGRQAECVYFLLTGYNRKELPKKLHVSYTSTENYITEARKKFKYNEVYSFLEFVKTTDFVESYAENYNLLETEDN